jgi:hypothetical protein
MANNSKEKVNPIDMIEAGENIFRVLVLLNGDLAEEIRGLKDYNTLQASETLDIIYTLDIAIKLLDETRANIKKQMDFVYALERAANKEAQQ